MFLGSQVKQITMSWGERIEGDYERNVLHTAYTVGTAVRLLCDSVKEVWQKTLPQNTIIKETFVWLTNWEMIWVLWWRTLEKG